VFGGYDVVLVWDSVVWRATVDEDGHYSFAVVLRWRSPPLAPIGRNAIVHDFPLPTPPLLSDITRISSPCGVMEGDGNRVAGTARDTKLLSKRPQGAAMSSSAIGLACLLVFALSQGVRDALFGNVFQSVSFFLVAALAFGTSTLCLSGLALLRQPKDFERLVRSPLMFAALNATTAVAWLSFFFGLKYLEPAVVATLYNGLGPLTVLALSSLG
jgi:hypothetical protein